MNDPEQEKKDDPIVPQTLQEPDPLEPTETQQPTSKKLSRKRILIIIGSCLALVAAAATAYILIFNPFAQEETTQSNNSDSSLADQKPVTEPNAQTILNKVRSAVTTELAATYPVMTIEENSYAPAYKAEGIGYAVKSNELGKGIDITPDPNVFELTKAEKVREVIKATLETEKSLSVTTNDWQMLYKNNTALCALGTEQSNTVSFSCVDTIEYSALIKSLKPFGEAYLASEDGKTYGQDVMMSNPIVTEKSPGHSNATVSMGGTSSPIGGYAGLFYTKNREWTYWRGTQSQIPCVDFNTYDLQKAFEGVECYDESSEASTVKVTVQ